MKKQIYLFTILLSTLFSYQSFSQIKVGIRGGIVSNNFNINDYSKEIDNVTNGDKQVGMHIGGIVRITAPTGKFIFELDPSFVNTKSEFTLNDESSLIKDLLVEDDQWRMDLPIMFGTRFAGFLDLMAGPSLSLNLGNSISYDKVSTTVEQDYKSIVWGYQVGAGIKISKFIVDVRYVGSLDSVTDGIKIGDTTYETDAKPTAMLLSLAVLL